MSKALAAKASHIAALESRSLSNYIETLIKRDVETHEASRIHEPPSGYHAEPTGKQKRTG